VALLLADEQLKNPGYIWRTILIRESFGSPQKQPSVRLFAELKYRDRARDEVPFMRPQNIGKAALNSPTARMMFKMIQPDLECSGSHCLVLLDCRHRVCEIIRVSRWRNSGGLWQGL
jgi:hypothetical protein